MKNLRVNRCQRCEGLNVLLWSKGISERSYYCMGCHSRQIIQREQTVSWELFISGISLRKGMYGVTNQGKVSKQKINTKLRGYGGRATNGVYNDRGCGGMATSTNTDFKGKVKSTRDNY